MFFKFTRLASALFGKQAPDPRLPPVSPSPPDRPREEQQNTPPKVNNVTPDIQEEPMPYLPKATRDIDLIVIHCTATHPYMDIGVAEINEWHKKRGWSGIGYHGVIRQDGSFERGRDINTAGAHARGHNRGSIGVSLVGGLNDEGRPSPDFKRAQWSTLKKVVAELRKQYPNAKITGHNTLGPKACPSFKVEDWLKTGKVVPVR